MFLSCCVRVPEVCFDSMSGLQFVSVALSGRFGFLVGADRRISIACLGRSLALPSVFEQNHATADSGI